MKLWEVIKEIQEDDSKVFYKEMENGKVVVKISAKTGYLEINLYDKYKNGDVIFARAESISKFHIDGNEWKLEEKVSTLNEILEDGYVRAKLSSEIVSAIISKFEETYNPENWDSEIDEDIASVEEFCRQEKDINYIVYKTSGYTHIETLKELLTSKCWIGVR